MSSAPATTATSASSWKAGPKSRALFEEEQLHLAPGLQQIATFSGLAMDSGRGAILRDVDGNEYIDFVAGVGVASLGYSHPEYVRAVSEQLSRIAVGSFTTSSRVSFARRLMEHAPQGLSRLQLYSSGAEAVEAALRLAKSRTKKYEVVSFWGGFHGKTGGVLGLLGDSFKHELGPLMPGLHLSPFPNPYRCPFKAGPGHDCAAHCLDFLRETLKRSTAGALAAIIVEPIQGTAGNVIPPAGFLPGLREIAREKGALLILDEMITGFGRTGKMFGGEHEGVVPDIMTMGKGMAGGFPVSAILTSSEVAMSKPFANPSGSSSSYGGNPLASAACDAALAAVVKDGLVANSARVGAELLQRFKAMAQRLPFIGHVDGRGLMIGLELVSDPTARAPLPAALCREIFEEALSRGLLTMAYNASLRVNPPLCISTAEALRGADLLEESLAAVAKRHALL